MDTLSKIRMKTQANRRLYGRMDTDWKIAYLNQFVMTDTKGKKVSGVANVTMNDPAVYANAITSTLMTSKWQTQITSKVKEFKTHTIEQFLIPRTAAPDLPKPSKTLIPVMSQSGGVGASLQGRQDKEGTNEQNG
jgi:hypothetical protein